jgi:hypothetical protein
MVLPFDPPTARRLPASALTNAGQRRAQRVAATDAPATAGQQRRRCYNRCDKEGRPHWADGVIASASRGARTPRLLIRSQAERRTARNLEADETEGKGTNPREEPPKRGGHSGDSRDYRRTVLVLVRRACAHRVCRSRSLSRRAWVRLTVRRRRDWMNTSPPEARSTRSAVTKTTSVCSTSRDGVVRGGRRGDVALQAADRAPVEDPVRVACLVDVNGPSRWFSSSPWCPREVHAIARTASHRLRRAGALCAVGGAHAG